MLKIEDIKEQFNINTFGYGNDVNLILAFRFIYKFLNIKHDAEKM